MSETNISPEARCVELRQCLEPLGDQLDELDTIRAAQGGHWTAEQAERYRAIDAAYEVFFGELFDLDEAVRNEPWK
jgi:hypothetical protein